MTPFNLFFYKSILILFLLRAWITGSLTAAPAVGARETGSLQMDQWRCEPTPEDSLGPFYEPGAPVRSSVGTGYELRGEVKSARDCSAISNARIELWLAGPDGEYDDDHRAVVLSDEYGRYSFESNVPPPYSFRPPHIHIRVTSPGYEDLVTQHYPERGAREATFELVLAPRSGSNV